MAKLPDGIFLPFPPFGPEPTHTILCSHTMNAIEEHLTAHIQQELRKRMVQRAATPRWKWWKRRKQALYIAGMLSMAQTIARIEIEMDDEDE
jgi:hypothetical protein